MKGVGIVLALFPATVAGQLAAFRGSVFRDTTGRGLAGAEVLLPELQERGITNELGRFEIRALPTGIWILEIRHPGFRPIIDSVEIRSGRETLRDYRMESAVQQLDSVRVTAPESRSVSPAMRGFEERRAAGFGHFITPADLRKMEDRKLSDILRGFPGTTIYAYRSFRFLGSGRGMSSIPDPRGRGAGPGMQHAIVADALSPVACWVQVFLDGIRLFTPNAGLDATDFDQFEGKQFEAIEFYGGPASTPTQFGGTGATCGTLVLWSRERIDPR